MGTTAVALAFVASNIDEANRWGQYNSDGDIVPIVAGCDIERFPDDNVAKVAAEAPVAGVRSAARKFEASSVNADKILVQGIEYHYSEIDRFTMRQSGIQVVAHAPENVRIDPAVFEELFHAPLSNNVEYDHPEISQMMDCFRRDIIENKKYAGSTYHIHLAPPGHCIAGMRFQPRNSVERCDAVGATLPQVEISFLGVDLVNHNLMMLSTSRTGRAANQAISRTLLHEAIHSYLTLSDVPLRLDPDEKLVKQIEGVTLNTLYPKGVPQAIRYP